MNHRALLPVFAATLFLSAFLIFAVQPMASKMLLPLLGGSPSVWNTAMVFFQAMLLGGYAYAHFIARAAPIKMQIVLHLILLAAFTLVLPLSIPKDAMPPEDSGQALWQLGIMLTCIGGPFFVLAASAPLFQHWFSCSGHKDGEDPYFLYAISNAGSMIALLGYPILFEPLLTLGEQTQSWFGGYVLLMALTAACGFLVRNGSKPIPKLDNLLNVEKLTNKTRLIWIALSFIPSSLMLGVTTMITTDLASTPFIWIVPLTLYLVTFIIAFSKRPIISLAVTRELTVYLICFVVLSFIIMYTINSKFLMMSVHLTSFFFCALLCHSELAKSKPSTSHLTEFFLLVSLGGVLGGIFNALIAPNIFVLPIEYSLTLGMVTLVILLQSQAIPVIRNRFNAVRDKHIMAKLRALDISTISIGVGLCLFAFYIPDMITKMAVGIAIFAFLLVMAQNRLVFSVTATLALLLFQSPIWNSGQKIVTLDRNYFGVVKVTEKKDVHFFYHGTTLHGAESQKPDQKFMPITYYSPGGPASDVFEVMKKRGGNQNVAALGLGVGSIACYKAKGRNFDFYEIDSDVVRIAEDTRYFSYLKQCGSPYKTILGDARMKILDAKPNQYGMIFIDTFSSDNIPVHIMTKEAFEIYLTKLAPGGLIVMNISNRFLDLRPVINAISQDLGLIAYFKMHPVKKKTDTISELYTDSAFAVIARKPQTVAPFIEQYGWVPHTKHPEIRPWTDDYANILGSLTALQ